MNISNTLRYGPSIGNISFAMLLIGAQLTLMPALAKDLYVATNGNDNVTYAANDEFNPWQTIQKGIVSLQAGDTLYIRGGNYQATSQIDIDSRTGVGASGTQANPIRVTSYPGESVVIDLNNVRVWLYIVGLHYWEISNLEFRNALFAVEIGGTALQVDNATIRNNRVTMNRGGDNSAAFSIGAASNTIVDGNEVIGPGTGLNIHQNTGCIHMNRSTNIQILNNTVSNCPNGIHFKHANENTPGADIEIAYNYIFNTGRSGIHYNGNYGYIHDNILGPGSHFRLPLDNGVPGGHNNVIEHNTILGTLNIQQAGGGGQNNVVSNNLFTQPVIISQYLVVNHNTTLNFNLHPPGTVVNEFGTTYTLQSWQNYYGGSANSLSASPTFSGGANPTSAAGYELAPSSVGIAAASTGADMGARLDLFGTSGLALVRPASPSSLVAN